MGGTLICLDRSHPEGYALIFSQKPPSKKVACLLSVLLILFSEELCLEAPQKYKWHRVLYTKDSVPKKYFYWHEKSQ